MTVCRRALLFLMASGSLALGKDRLEDAQRYWEWSNYWREGGSLDFPYATYPSSALDILEFEGSGGAGPYWGFCSKQLAVCHAYSAYDDGVIANCSATRIRKGETEIQALGRFAAQRFLDESSPAVSAGQPPPYSSRRRTALFAPLVPPESVRMHWIDWMTQWKNEEISVAGL